MDSVHVADHFLVRENEQTDLQMQKATQVHCGTMHENFIMHYLKCIAHIRAISMHLCNFHAFERMPSTNPACNHHCLMRPVFNCNLPMIGDGTSSVLSETVKVHVCHVEGYLPRIECCNGRFMLIMNSLYMLYMSGCPCLG